MVVSPVELSSFLFTSRAEWFPMTILEALWCWLPVFISEWCNFPEVDGVVGKVVKNEISDVRDLDYFLHNKCKFLKQMKLFLYWYSLKNLVNILITNYEK